MFETVVVATDGSESVARAIDCTLDLASRFDATVHALYVVNENRAGGLPDDLHDDVLEALDERGRNALERVISANEAHDAAVPLRTAVRSGRPADVIIDYVREIDADAVAMGTRGRSGEHSYLLGSVAEAVVRTCPKPVLTVRQLEP